MIGCGVIARDAHIPSFQKIEGVEVSCIADTNQKRLERVSRKFNIRKTFSDYRELLEEELDLVSICAPSYLHAQMCVDAARTKKNILVEKPLALSVEEALRVEKAVRESHVKLCVVHNELYNPAMLLVTKMWKRGELGRVLSIQAIKHTSIPDIRPKNWRPFGFSSSAKSGGELFEFIHPIYLLDFFGGDLRDLYVVSGRVCEKFDEITDVRAILTFETGCIGYLEMLGFAATDLFLVNIHGTGLSVSVDLFNNSYRIRRANPQLSELSASIRDAWNLSKTLIRRRWWYWMQGSHLTLISRFVESVREDRDPPVTVGDGARAVRLAEAIKKGIGKNSS